MRIESPVIRQLIEEGLFNRLPRTFATVYFDRIKNWSVLFPAERDYFERLAALLNSMPRETFEQLFFQLRAVETKMGITARNWDIEKFTLKQVDFLQRSPFYQQWRREVANVFSYLDPILQRQVATQGHPRLVLIISPLELPFGPDRMWQRVRKRGKIIPLHVPSNLDLEDYLPLILTGAPAKERKPTLPQIYATKKATSRYDAWLIEADNQIYQLTSEGHAWTRLSYVELKNYRDRLMESVNEILTRKKIPGPQQLAAELKKLHVHPSESEFASDPILAEFLRAVLLTGNGTLLVNNTFVEWATIQAVRRAKPSVAIVSFGIRNKIKPFSSLLIYTDQDKANPIPTQMDTLGTYIDLEVFYQYLWQEFEKYAEYQLNTAYLFIGQGLDAMLAICPPDFPLASTTGPIELTDIYQAARQWLQI